MTQPPREGALIDAILSVLERQAGGIAPTLAKPAALPVQDLAAVARRVLVVEDNPVNRRVAEAMLTKLGCRVDIAGNGRQACDMVSQLPYDVIFMDCLMPEMDGYEATRHIRQHEVSGRHTPVIAVTACAMQGDRERCLEAGMDGYMCKPVSAAAFQEVLERWMGLPEMMTEHSHSAAAT
jgi:CheY-like chemotaxis protein